MRTARFASTLVLCFVMVSAACFADVATRASIRGDGVLLVDGKPVFVIGALCEKLDPIPEIAEAGCNLVQGSGEWGPKHYEAARKHNLLILAGHHVWMNCRGTLKEIDVRAEEQALLKTVVMNARDQGRRTIHDALEQFDHLPGVIGWNLSDEPRSKLSEIAATGYEIFKSNSPSHIVTQIAPGMGRYMRTATDVLIVDQYPFQGTPRRRKYRYSALGIYECISSSVKDMEGKPVWYMSQLQPPSRWSLRAEEEVTLRDMRLADYSAIIGGAKGVIMFHWAVLPYAWTVKNGSATRIKVTPEVYAQRVGRIKAMVAELKVLAPIIIEGRPAHDIGVTWVAPGLNGPGPQIYGVWDRDGKRYLMAVNLLDAPIVGQVFGANRTVNGRAYDATVFLGKEDVTVTPSKRAGEFFFSVAPRGAGVLELTRRPIPRVKEK